MNNKELKEQLTQIIFDESNLYQHILEQQEDFFVDEEDSDLIIVGWDSYIPDFKCRHLLLRNKKGELIRHKVIITISDGRKVKNHED